MIGRPLPLLLGGLLMGVAAMGIWKFGKGDSGWKAYRQELVDRGERLEWNEWKSHSVDSEQNVLSANVITTPVVGRLKDLPLWSGASRKRPWAGDGIRITDYFAGGMRMGAGIDSLRTVRAATVEEAESSLAQYFEGTGNRILAVRNALDRTHCQLLGSFNGTEPILDLRYASAALHMEMELLAVHGHYCLHREEVDEAFKSCRATWQIVAHARQLPALEGALASRRLSHAALPLLFAGLQDRAWNQEQISELLDLLPPHTDGRWLLDRLREERALYLSAAERYRDASHPEGVIRAEVNPDILAVPYHWNGSDCLRFCQLLDQAFFQRFEDREDFDCSDFVSCIGPLVEFRKSHPVDESRLVLTGKATPSEQLSGFVVPKLITFADEAEPPIELELARVAAMIEKYRLKHSRYPQSFAELGAAPSRIGYHEIAFLVKADGTIQVHAHGRRGRSETLRRIGEGDSVWQYTQTIE